MSEKSDEEGFLVVYPNGTGRLDEFLLTWNAGTCCGYALEHNIDDVGFIRTLLERLEQQVRIDPSRIYVTGISNGGMMTYRLACDLADTVAAIAPVAAALNEEDCSPSRPVSVIIFHGTADEHVPYNGGIGSKARDERVDKPVRYAVSFWVNRNRCSPNPVVEEFGSIRKETYGGGIDGTEVVLYTILGGGHAWPGGEKGYRWGDEPTKEISATDLMWEFFASHPKRMHS
jgi:polyhydroxybutyrate depolymerase